MLKNAYFLEKDVKNRFSVGSSAPRPPRCYSRLLLQLCQSSFLALKAVYYLQQRINFASSKFLQLFFTSNSVVFVGRGRKNISCPRAQGTLATPLDLQSDFWRNFLAIFIQQLVETWKSRHHVKVSGFETLVKISLSFSPELGT